MRDVSDFLPPGDTRGEEDERLRPDSRAILRAAGSMAPADMAAAPTSGDDGTCKDRLESLFCGAAASAVLAMISRTFSCLSWGVKVVSLITSLTKSCRDTAPVISLFLFSSSPSSRGGAGGIA